MRKLFLIGQKDSVRKPWITKKVYHECADELYQWVNVEGILPQLMKHKIISGPDDMHGVTTGSPCQKMNFLYSKLCSSRNGFQLFYRCLRESQDDHLGHRDAADKLEETGTSTHV